MKDVGNLPLVGGHVALDLANTVSGRLEDPPRDRLQDFGDVVTWGRRVGLLELDEARAWREWAEAETDRAVRALEGVRRVREVIFRVCSAVAGGQAPAGADLEVLSDEWGREAVARRLDWSEGQPVWRRPRAASDVRSITGPIVASAVDLLFGPDRARIKRCGGSDCGWLFVDGSRNRSRRWCDMADCGNRAKARRHYRKVRASR